MVNPEVENSKYRENHQTLLTSKTSIDILEVPKNPGSDVKWRENLDHDALLHHLAVSLFSITSRRLPS